VYSFASVITGIFAGLFVRFYLRRLKPVILTGIALFLVAFGILIRFRGGSNAHSGILGGQILLGIAGGLFPYSAQALIQTEGGHQHTAILLASYLGTSRPLSSLPLSLTSSRSARVVLVRSSASLTPASTSLAAIYSVGSAFGNSISGAIWTQVLPGELEKVTSNATAVELWYGSPFVAITEPDGQWGEPIRMGVVEAYRHVQKLLCITGICLAVLLVGCGLVLKDPVLGAEQSLPAREEKAQGEEESEAA